MSFFTITDKGREVAEMTRAVRDEAKMEERTAIRYMVAGVRNKHVDVRVRAAIDEIIEGLNRRGGIVLHHNTREEGGLTT